MSRIRLFPGMVFVLLGFNGCMVATTLYLANSDRSFAVEPEYDRKALAWDQTAAQRARSRELNWGVELQVGGVGVLGRYLALRLSDSKGGPVHGATVSMVAFHSARAAQRYSLDFKEQSEGEYVASIPVERPGLWHFELLARSGTDMFTGTLERSIPAAGVLP